MEDALRNLPMPVVVNMASEEEPPGTERQVLLDKIRILPGLFSVENAVLKYQSGMDGSTWLNPANWVSR